VVVVAAVRTAVVVGAIVVGAIVVGAIVVGAIVVGAAEIEGVESAPSRRAASDVQDARPTDATTSQHLAANPRSPTRPTVGHRTGPDPTEVTREVR
jgi:hypothetical protein